MQTPTHPKSLNWKGYIDIETGDIIQGPIYGGRSSSEIKFFSEKEFNQIINETKGTFGSRYWRHRLNGTLDKGDLKKLAYEYLFQAAIGIKGDSLSLYNSSLDSYKKILGELSEKTGKPKNELHSDLYHKLENDTKNNIGETNLEKITIST